MRLPDSILEKATITLTSSGMRQAVIQAETLFVFEKEDSTTAADVKADFFDDKGQYQSTLTADRGLVREKQETFTVWGNVVVHNDTSRLETQSLNWDSKKNLITTDDFVRFQRGGDVVTGYGMVADSKLENVRILRDVKGKLINVPKTEQGLDSLESKGTKGTLP